MIMSTKEICKRGLSMTISLTLGNSVFPAGDGLRRNSDCLSHMVLCFADGFSQFFDFFTYMNLHIRLRNIVFTGVILLYTGVSEIPIRSEERRVGKECRSRWSPYH